MDHPQPPGTAPSEPQRPTAGPNPARIDPATGLPLPDPFPDYITCPHCGEAEVEIWCYQTQVRCHNCGAVLAHTPPPGCGTFPYCRRGVPPSDNGDHPGSSG